MEITLRSSTKLVDDIWRLEFTRPTALTFDAGDYVELGLGQAGSRWLSIASSPTDTEKLEFITKISKKRSTFKQAIYQLEPSDKAAISPAIGNFNLPRTDTKHLLWVAGGIGITPYLSMMRWLHDNPKRQPNIDLVFGAKAGQHIFLDEVKASNVNLHQLELRPKLSDITDTITDSTIIYLSGPQPLCEDLNQQLLDSGVKRSRIKLDYFEGYDTL